MTSRIIRNTPEAQDPNIKTSNYLNSLLALQDVKSRGADDAILCDGQGRVAEGTTFSVFAVREDGTIITPSLEVGILDSITRRRVIKRVSRTREVKEGFYPLADMQGCAEVFIVSSVREAVPVSQWDDKTYQVPGPVTLLVQEELKAEVAEYIATHEKF